MTLADLYKQNGVSNPTTQVSQLAERLRNAQNAHNVNYLNQQDEKQLAKDANDKNQIYKRLEVAKYLNEIKGNRQPIQSTSNTYDTYSTVSQQPNKTTGSCHIVNGNDENKVIPDNQIEFPPTSMCKSCPIFDQLPWNTSTLPPIPNPQDLSFRLNYTEVVCKYYLFTHKYNINPTISVVVYINQLVSITDTLISIKDKNGNASNNTYKIYTYSGYYADVNTAPNVRIQPRECRIDIIWNLTPNKSIPAVVYTLHNAQYYNIINKQLTNPKTYDNFNDTDKFNIFSELKSDGYVEPTATNGRANDGYATSTQFTLITPNKKGGKRKNTRRRGTKLNRRSGRRRGRYTHTRILY